MKKSLFILLAIFVALLATPSCKKEKGAEGPPAIKVSGVSLDKTPLGLMVGDKVKLVATVIPDDATNMRQIKMYRTRAMTITLRL